MVCGPQILPRECLGLHPSNNLSPPRDRARPHRDDGSSQPGTSSGLYFDGEPVAMLFIRLQLSSSFLLVFSHLKVNCIQPCGETRSSFHCRARRPLLCLPAVAAAATNGCRINSSGRKRLASAAAGRRPSAVHAAAVAGGSVSSGDARRSPHLLKTGGKCC